MTSTTRRTRRSRTARSRSGRRGTTAQVATEAGSDPGLRRDERWLHRRVPKFRGIPVEQTPSHWVPKPVQCRAVCYHAVSDIGCSRAHAPGMTGEQGEDQLHIPVTAGGGTSDHGRRPGAIPAFGVHRGRALSAGAMARAAMSSIMFPSSPHRSGYPNGALSASTARCGAPGVLGRTCRTSAGEWRRTAITSDFRGQISPSRNPVDFPWVILLPFPPASH